MDLVEFKRNIKQVGAFKALEDVALRALNLGVFFKILKGVKINAVHPEFLKCDEKYRGLFLTEGMLTEFAERPEYELSKRFLGKALAKGDECYGFLNGNVLGSLHNLQQQANIPFPNNIPGNFGTLAYIQFGPTGAAFSAGALTINSGFLTSGGFPQPTTTNNYRNIFVDNIVGHVQVTSP